MKSYPDLLKWLTTRLAPLLVVFSAVSSEREPIEVIPAVINYDVEKAKLGKKLFLDKRLSADNSISCESCHQLDNAGVDLKPVSVGINGQRGVRNSPTVYNSVFNFRQFWDGRADDLVQQAGLPVINKLEMGMSSMDDVANKLRDIPEYVTSFNAAFGGEITPVRIQEAIAEFETTLVTPNAKFDRYLQGDETAISDSAKHGYQLFKSFGCASCHQGKNVGGNLFQKFGVLKDSALRDVKDTDLGRYEVTRNEWDKRVFKVPSLRLAYLTPPYFHDGSVPTLEEAVDIMIEFQLGRNVPQQDRKDIIEFLSTLPGDMTGGKLP